MQHALERHTIFASVAWTVLVIFCSILAFIIYSIGADVADLQERTKIVEANLNRDLETEVLLLE